MPLQPSVRRPLTTRAPGGLPFVSAAHRAGLLLTAAIGVPRRLLCNLLDGMVAVAGGLGSPSGQVWNDLPDRIGAGHGIAYRWGAALPAGLAAR